MQFILTSGWDDGTADLAQRLVHELASGKRVLWLLSGGSNVAASVEVMRNIPEEHANLLTIMLGDERYGPVGHSDSNMAQLMEAGFEVGRAHVLPTLQDGMDLNQTADYFANLVAGQFASANVIIGQMGIGEDGHICGILPESAAAKEPLELTIGYHSEVYDRISLTFPGLRKLDAAYVFAFGAGKATPLKELEAKAKTPVQEPAQILHHIEETYIYNDQIGSNN